MTGPLRARQGSLLRPLNGGTSQKAEVDAGFLYREAEITQLSVSAAHLERQFEATPVFCGILGAVFCEAHFRRQNFDGRSGRPQPFSDLSRFQPGLVSSPNGTAQRSVKVRPLGELNPELPSNLVNPHRFDIEQRSTLALPTAEIGELTKCGGAAKGDRGRIGHDALAMSAEAGPKKSAGFTLPPVSA